MRTSGRLLVLAVLLAGLPHHATAKTYDERPTWQRIGFSVLAGVYNVVPVASALVTPRCIQGYFLCKLSFAGVSLLAAGEQLVFSGGSDLKQTRAILQRGLGGDWILTGRHAARDVQPEVLPEPGPPS